MKVYENQSLLITGSVGNLEIKISNPLINKLQEWVVICHPHPKFGGSMDNKVVTTLQKTFHNLGYGTVIFNFRGAGRSAGQYSEGIGEQDDLVAVVNWLKANFTVNNLMLAGFSFGAYIALKKADSLQASQLCIVAPAVGLYDFSQIKVNIKWLLIQGGQDEVVSATAVLSWAMQQSIQPDIHWRAISSHFFDRQLTWLKGVITLTYK